MKTVTTFITAAAFSLLAFGASAQTISATGNTLDSAEAALAAKAKAEGKSDYKITSARMGNFVMMTAELDK
ncbi:DUF1471 domain-containing protein [Trabulsiella odontotermitis]|uniref:YdgH/BhsA/McbA-like domain containing protein n=1 Tax=Trabulsiella odontotermitis TaxID=379893 RepID=UPI0024B63B33|nr:YdgH/BhsA/McbA-like domain containing protein [Trabulsiella odontotermitis]WHP32304.1 DUF1471 domain-containing protein [Trabulsiella odontotermitis]